MARSRAPRGGRRKRAASRSRFARLWAAVRPNRRWWRAWKRSSTPVKVIAGAAVAVTLSLAVNWIYQVVRKPSELFFPVSGTLYKTPSETWREYAPLFRKYATSVMTPELLAAMAQVEGSGNPVARTYWRWSWTSKPFEMYRPASSAVGMYQITDGTFAEASRYCIHHHTVAEAGPWDSRRTCWFNGLYARVVPSDAVELTSAYLDRSVAAILERQKRSNATLPQRQALAAVIHLCGAGAGDAYARRGFRPTDGERCGDHDVRAYIAHTELMRELFVRLAERPSNAAP